LEGFAFLRPLYSSTANALYAHPEALYSAINIDLDTLQVGEKSTAGDARRLSSNAAQVFCFATPLDLIAEVRSFAADGTVHPHCRPLP
jgi:hypothetical protein